MQSHIAEDVRTRVARIYGLAGVVFVASLLPYNESIQFGHYAAGGLKVWHVSAVAFWGLVFSLAGLWSQRRLFLQEKIAEQWLDNADELLVGIKSDASLSAQLKKSPTFEDDLHIVQLARATSETRLRRIRVGRFLGSIIESNAAQNTKSLAGMLLQHQKEQSKRADTAEIVFTFLHLHVPILVGTVAVLKSGWAGGTLLWANLVPLVQAVAQVFGFK
jgi:hypothetical protein